MPRRPSLVSLARARSEVTGRTASRNVLLRALEIAAEIADDTDQPVTGRTRAIIEVRALRKGCDVSCRVCVGVECQVPDVDGSGVGASGVDGSGEDAGAGVVGAGVDDSDADGAGVDGAGVDDGVDGAGVDDGVDVAGVDAAGVDDGVDGAGVDDGVDDAGVDVGAGVGVFDDDGSAVAVSGAASDNPGTPVAVSRPLIEFLPWTRPHPVTSVRFALVR